MAASTLAASSVRCTTVHSGLTAARPRRPLKSAFGAAKGVRRTALRCDAKLHSGHVEVAKNHPQYQTALLHEAIDDSVHSNKRLNFPLIVASDHESMVVATDNQWDDMT
eukprot:594510-Pyramimonas_sp.AAC.1